jgi:hypothetical protein
MHARFEELGDGKEVKKVKKGEKQDQTASGTV